MTCSVCDRSVEMSGMGGHVTQSHFLELNEYEGFYGKIETQIKKKIYHKCAICSSPTYILMDLVEIAKHMKRHKNMTPKHYMK